MEFGWFAVAFRVTFDDMLWAYKAQGTKRQDSWYLWLWNCMGRDAGYAERCSMAI